jgi:hypothetical protein
MRFFRFDWKLKTSEFQMFEALYFKAEDRSEDHYRGLEGMCMYAQTKEDFRHLFRILEFEGYQVVHPQVVICTTGMLFAN